MDYPDELKRKMDYAAAQRAAKDNWAKEMRATMDEAFFKYCNGDAVGPFKAVKRGEGIGGAITTEGTGLI